MRGVVSLRKDWVSFPIMSEMEFISSDWVDCVATGSIVILLTEVLTLGALYGVAEARADRNEVSRFSLPVRFSASFFSEVLKASICCLVICSTIFWVSVFV